MNALIKNKLIIFLKSLFYRINRHISPKWVEHANKDDIAFFHVRKEFALFKFADIHHALVITKAFFSFRGGEGKVFNRCLHSLSVFLAEILHSRVSHVHLSLVHRLSFSAFFESLMFGVLFQNTSFVRFTYSPCLQAEACQERERL